MWTLWDYLKQIHVGPIITCRLISAQPYVDMFVKAKLCLEWSLRTLINVYSQNHSNLEAISRVFLVLSHLELMVRIFWILLDWVDGAASNL